MEAYVLIPFKYASEQVAVLRMGQVWANGVLLTRLALFVARFVDQPLTPAAAAAGGAQQQRRRNARERRGIYERFMSNIDHVFRGGLYPRPRVLVAWTRIVIPSVVGGAFMLLVPFLIAHLIIQLEWVDVASRQAEQLVLRKVFGALQSAVALLVARLLLVKRMETWTDLLKDEVFLESTELKNYNPVEARQQKGKSKDHNKDEDENAEEEGEWETLDPSNPAATQEGGEGDGEGEANEYVAEGTLPDVLFR